MPDLLKAVFIPLASCTLLCLYLERLILPCPLPIHNRSWPARGLMLCGILLVFCLELLLFRRPWFAASAVSGLFLLLVLISNTKYHTLREPFFFQDFEYFTDAIRHPRLYIPFFGIGKSILGVMLFLALVALGIHAEAPLTLQHGWIMPIIVWLGLLLAAGTGIKFCLPHLAQPSFDPIRDLQQHGLLACLFAYWQSERQTVRPQIPSWWDEELSSDKKPHLLVVQSESFVDLRRHYPQIRPDILNQLDYCQQEAMAYGQLDVPAWGANTVRSEYAFLSGMTPEQLGVHRFNPYRKYARHSPYTLAAWLKKQGYRTICVHPYSASFYRRDVTYPAMGFDEFIDIAAFGDIQEDMPYISDTRVAKKVCELLCEPKQPLFIFVITMENHGPLHLEKPTVVDEKTLYANGSAPEGCEDLTIYLRHLRNANKMIGTLRQHLQAMVNPALFCWYGDHVPIMPCAYQQLGMPESKTDYFICSSRIKGNATASDIGGSELAAELVKHLQRY